MATCKVNMWIHFYFSHEKGKTLHWSKPYDNWKALVICINESYVWKWASLPRLYQQNTVQHIHVVSNRSDHFSVFTTFIFLEKKPKQQQLQCTFIFMKLIIQNYLISIKPNEISKSRYHTCIRLSDKQKYSQYCFSNMSQPLNLPFPMKSKYLNICIWKCTYKIHADIYCNII